MMEQTERKRMVTLLAGVDQVIAGWQQQIETAQRYLQGCQAMKHDIESRLNTDPEQRTNE